MCALPISSAFMSCSTSMDLKRPKRAAFTSPRKGAPCSSSIMEVICVIEAGLKKADALLRCCAAAQCSYELRAAHFFAEFLCGLLRIEFWGRTSAKPKIARPFSPQTIKRNRYNANFGAVFGKSKNRPAAPTRRATSAGPSSGGLLGEALPGVRTSRRTSRRRPIFSPG